MSSLRAALAGASLLAADLLSPYSARGASLVCVLRGPGARVQLQALRRRGGGGGGGGGGGTCAAGASSSSSSSLSSSASLSDAECASSSSSAPHMAPLPVPRPPPRLSVRLSWRALGPLLLVGGGAAQWGPFQAGLLFALLGCLVLSASLDLAADPAIAADAGAGGAGLGELLERAASAGASLLALGAPLALAGLAMHALAR
jgi:hypothetical protein